MLAEKLINTLEKLLKLHQNLYEVTLQKTDYLKSNDIEKLKELLKKEQMFVQAIKQMEDERIGLTAKFLGREHELTLSACVDQVEGEQKHKLEEFALDLTEILDKLRVANQLNKELTQQALQFVSLTLDMLMPQENITNYQHPTHQNQTQHTRKSLFDSQA